jgi:guanylate kinase
LPVQVRSVAHRMQKKNIHFMWVFFFCLNEWRTGIIKFMIMDTLKNTPERGNIICLITGPAGSGKSSVSNSLAKKFDHSAVIEVDTLRGMIKGGYVRPWPHTEAADLQLSLSAKNACDMATNFMEKGFNVFIDDVVGRKLLEQYSHFFKGKNFQTFLLMPSLESLLNRFDDRGNDGELRERTVELHKQFSEKKDNVSWQVVDSSTQTLEDTVEQIYEKITT